jgi:hypothetical protein
MNGYFIHRSEGQLVFDPKRGTKYFEPWWALLACDQDIARFYAWLLKKHGLPTQKNGLWGAHVSVIKGDEPPEKNLWGKPHKLIEFWYTNQIRWDNGVHAWLDVCCPQMSAIRQSMGLPPKDFYHMTLGRLEFRIAPEK